ncbi:MAG: beta-lactamase family protein [Gemmatimonadaceae bacterium]|nr:beta-lactamase family protein [Gemmatimonadaceae bacterium]
MSSGRAVAVALLGVTTAHAQPKPAAATLGFSTARLARIDSALDAAVAREEIAGAVVLVLRDDQVVYERAAGWRDRDAKRPMTTDAIFRIASQSKALTSVATLMLMEEGKFLPTTPVSRFMPTFARTSVAVKRDTGIAIVPARRAITIRDLLTHTAGISYGTDAIVAERYRAKGLGPAQGPGWYTANKTEPICATMDTLGTLPFVAQPGEAWVYGYNTDVLGCVVERASGMPLDQFIAERITRPLGMKNTYFYLPPAERDRLVTVYMSRDGKAVRSDDPITGQGHYLDGPRVSFAGGAGLLSTARDYARFLQMLAHGGTWAGRQYLAPHTVGLMTSNQVGALHGAGVGFGFGFETIESYGASNASSAGTWGWGGAYGSNYKVDPVEGLTMVVMINQLPIASDIVARVQFLTYAALTKSRRR